MEQASSEARGQLAPRRQTRWQEDDREDPGWDEQGGGWLRSQLLLFFFCNLGPVFSCLPRSALSFRTQLPGWSPHSRILREAVSSQIHPRIFCEPCVFLVLPFFYVPDPTENPSFILASYCLCFSGTHHPRGKYSYFSLCIWMFGVSGRDFSTA